MADKKRTRINGTFRWREQQARELVTIVLENVQANPEQFEKPTAQKFYERISKNSTNIHNIKWDIMRTKMRHLKTSFLTALKWKHETGAGLLENGDVNSVDEYIKRTCPFYDDLHSIFGRRVNIQPPAICQSTQPVSSLENNVVKEEVPLEIDCGTSYTSSFESPLASPSILLSPMPSDNEVSPPVALSPTLSENQASLSRAFASNLCIQKQTTTSKRNLKRAHSSTKFALLFEIQKKRVELEAKKLELEAQKLEFEAQKLEFEKEKEANKLKFQKLQLEKEERIEMEKIRLEHKRLKCLKK